MLCLGLGHEALLARRDHLSLDALQHVALLEPGEALQQNAALGALPDALHIQPVALEAGAHALVDLHRAWRSSSCLSPSLHRFSSSCLLAIS